MRRAAWRASGPSRCSRDGASASPLRRPSRGYRSSPRAPPRPGPRLRPRLPTPTPARESNRCPARRLIEADGSDKATRPRPPAPSRRAPCSPASRPQQPPRHPPTRPAHKQLLHTSRRPPHRLPTNVRLLSRLICARLRCENLQ